jgi:glycosyltransferase involved in cell wall biosynthesis
LGALDFLIELESNNKVENVIGSLSHIEPTNEDTFLLERFLANTGQTKDFPAEPDESMLMKQADVIAFNIGYGAAIAYVTSHLPLEKSYLKHILYASKAIIEGKEDEWLFHLNKYLSHFNLSPLKLKSGSSLFERLDCCPEKTVDDGSLISVIMPAFNAEKTLKMAADSILNQSWKNLELLIVDDCSVDNTYEIMKELAKSDSRVRLFKNEVNVGPYVSKNVALSQSSGDWITGHDADDWAHPERLERQVEYCLKNRVPACLSGMMRMDGMGRFIRLNKVGGFVYDGATRSGFISLMVNRQYFLDVIGCWDNVRVAGDSELIRRIEAVHGEPIPQLPDLTMLCYDNPLGLTNHPTLGHSESGGVSPQRLKYKRSFTKYHQTLTRITSRYSFSCDKRVFDAPKELLNDSGKVQVLLNEYERQGLYFGLSKKVDVALITDLTFSGGNASSTIDELSAFIALNLTVALIHCPRDEALGYKLSNKYSDFKSCLVNWTEVSRIEADVLICRHPSVVVSHAFATISPKITAGRAFFVKNNSSFRADGRSVYEMSEYIERATQLRAASIEFCPISNVMREEIKSYIERSGYNVKLSSINWNPTFDSRDYFLQPKPALTKPFRLGRHGRDGEEKWLEDSRFLLEAYPNNPDYEICILGGAKKAAKILGGKLPKNWQVRKFGEISPKEYLRNLDVFVYFPHTALIEAFGRTVIEAIIAGVPVILPKRFESTFSDLAFYCESKNVSELVESLSKSNDIDRINFLANAQQVALDNYSSSVVKERIFLTGPSSKDCRQSQLSKESREFRSNILKQLC